MTTHRMRRLISTALIEYPRWPRIRRRSRRRCQGTTECTLPIGRDEISPCRPIPAGLQAKLRDTNPDHGWGTRSSSEEPNTAESDRTYRRCRPAEEQVRGCAGFGDPGSPSDVAGELSVDARDTVDIRKSSRRVGMRRSIALYTARACCSGLGILPRTTNWVGATGRPRVTSSVPCMPPTSFRRHEHPLGPHPPASGPSGTALPAMASSPSPSRLRGRSAGCDRRVGRAVSSFQRFGSGLLGVLACRAVVGKGFPDGAEAFRAFRVSTVW